MRRTILLSACLIALSGCATTSFAPPEVDVHTPMVSRSINHQCRVTYGTSNSIGPNVDGAQALISNYLDSYRCAMREAANGRQPWEILSFLSLVAATTATALGAGPHVAIIGNSANTVFTTANGYYAPRDQTRILNDAVDALACIQTQSVGIDPFELKAATTTQRNALHADQERSGGSATVEVTAERQYFNMVYSSLITTERAAAQRLAGRGFDAKGIQAQVDALTQQIKDAQEAKNKPPAPNPTVTARIAGTERVDHATAEAEARGVKIVQLDLGEVQPKLEKCALLAQGAG